jgi:hypothetical protein
MPFRLFYYNHADQHRYKESNRAMRQKAKISITWTYLILQSRVSGLVTKYSGVKMALHPNAGIAHGCDAE